MRALCTAGRLIVYARTVSVICVNIPSPRDRDVAQVNKPELSLLRSRHRNCYNDILCQGRNARLSEELEYAWPMTNLYPPREAPSDLGT